MSASTSTGDGRRSSASDATLSNRIELVRSPWEDHFVQLVNCVRKSLILCTPYVGAAPCSRLVRTMEARGDSNRIDVLIVTDLSLKNILSGATDPAALVLIADHLPRTVVRFLPSLHAKVYIADRSRAVVTSATLSQSGLCRNIEYGVAFRGRSFVSQVRRDIEDFASLGSPVSVDQLTMLADVGNDLREMSRQIEVRARRRLRREFDKRMRNAEVDILRIRVAGRAPHAIFAEAI